MTARDLPRCCEISCDIGFPASDKKLIRQWAGDQTTSSVVAVVDGKVVAYMIYQRCTDGLAIWQLRVDPVYQWRGIGRDLVDYLKGKLTLKRWMICVVVEAENIAACEFLRACRFKATEFKRGMFEDKQDGVEFRFIVDKTLLEALS